MMNLLQRYYYYFRGIKIGKNNKISLFASIKKVYGGSIIIGNLCEIHKGAIIHSYGGTIRIGDNCSINPYCILYGHGNLTIGNGVRIAAQTVIIPSNHNYSNVDRYIYQQGETSLGVKIEDDVWIGSGVKILDGVCIATGCIIGAGAVVTKSTKPYGIYVGLPAKFIKKRG
jgi:acetyltransferase-like isoleucine patch superfamily enzyme